MEVRRCLDLTLGPWGAPQEHVTNGLQNKLEEPRGLGFPESCKGLLESSHLNEPTWSPAVAHDWAQNRQEGQRRGQNLAMHHAHARHTEGTSSISCWMPTWPGPGQQEGEGAR